MKKGEHGRCVLMSCGNEIYVKKICDFKFNFN